ARKLIIAPSLQAPCYAAGVLAERLTQEWIAWTEAIQKGDILLDPEVADVAADVAARPVENVNGWRWRPVCWDADIGCDCWSGGYRDEDNTCKQNLLQETAPVW